MKKLFWNLLRENKNDYFQTIIGCSFIISLIYCSTTMGEYLSYLSTAASPQLLDLLIYAGKEFLIPYGILLVLLMLLISGYIRKRTAVYSMLMVFGIQKKHKCQWIAFEYLGIVVSSVIGGIILGILESWVIKKALECFLPTSIDQSACGYVALKAALIFSILIFGLCFLLFDEILACVGVDGIVKNEYEIRQRIRVSPEMCGVCIGMAGLTMVTIRTYWGKCGGVMPEFLAVTTILLFFYSFGARFVKHVEVDRKTYSNILWIDDWCSNFYRHINITYVVAVLLCIIVYTFAIRIVDNLPVVEKGNYPYDVVWGANEEDIEFLKELREQYGVEFKCIPSIRITSGDYGEHIGISASEYKKITGHKIELHDDEIFVVYQRDRSEYGTLGLDYGNKSPRLYVGNADADIWIYALKIMPGNKFSRSYTIVGDTNKIITGNFKNRQFEESGIKGKVFEAVIVFSDEEYQEICKTAKGSDLTVTMNIPHNYEAVVNKIYKYAAENSQVNFFDAEYGNLIYEKKDLLIEERESKMLEVCTMTINMITVICCIVFVLCSNVLSHKNRMKWKYTFFDHFGMSRREWKKHLYREIFITAKAAYIGSMPFTFLLVIIKVWDKGLPVSWTRCYLIAVFGIAVTVALILCCSMMYAANSCFKQFSRSIRYEE